MRLICSFQYWISSHLDSVCGVRKDKIMKILRTTCNLLNMCLISGCRMTLNGYIQMWCLLLDSLLVYSLLPSRAQFLDRADMELVHQTIAINSKYANNSTQDMFSVLFFFWYFKLKRTQRLNLFLLYYFPLFRSISKFCCWLWGSSYGHCMDNIVLCYPCKSSFWSSLRALLNPLL